MKVLITNGSIKSTWYYGMNGTILPVTHIENNHYMVPNDVVPSNELPPCGVHVPDGELLYTEKEYNDMENHYMKLLEEACEAKKIKLPREVVESIDKIKTHLSSEWKWHVIRIVSSTFPFFANTPEAPIRRIAEDRNNGIELLLQALVNGYEVEPEIPLEDELADIVMQWRKAESEVDDEDSDNRILIGRILGKIKQREQKSG